MRGKSLNISRGPAPQTHGRDGLASTGQKCRMCFFDLGFARVGVGTGGTRMWGLGAPRRSSSAAPISDPLPGLALAGKRGLPGKAAVAGLLSGKANFPAPRFFDPLGCR